MYFSSLAALVAAVATVSAQTYQGFNYGAANTDGSPVTQAQFEARFNAAQNLVGASGFTSARLFTNIQAGSLNDPISAIQAAINTDTSLLLGLWASAGQTNIDNELAAFRRALSAYGSEFTDRIVGISVGSEDLYRISPTGIENNSGVGAGPDVVADYINQVKDAIANTAAAGTPVGHVDTWTAWVNSSNNAVIEASDFIGMDAYPYFQNTMTNDIGNGYSLFFSAYDQTVAAAAGKPVWVTETGWPVSGPTENLAVPGTNNAETYWDQVGCGRLFGQVNTWWYILQDAFPNTPSPSFGVVGAGSSGTDVPTTPLYDLSCSDASSDAPASSSVIASSANPAASAQAGGQNTEESVSEADQAGINVPGGATSSGTPATNNAGSDNAGSDNTGSDNTGSDNAGSDNAGSDNAGSDNAGSDNAGSDNAGSDNAGSDNAGSDNNASDNAGSDNTGSDNGGSSGQTSEMDATTPAPTSTEHATPTTLITKTTALPSASAESSGCPARLDGYFEYPHLIIPVSKDHPDTASGTSFNGTISPSTSSIFNFDIRPGDAGKTCTLVFLLPTQDDLKSSAFSLHGDGGFNVARLDRPATEQTTYNSVPKAQQDLGGPPNVSPGNEYVISSGSCLAGQRVGYEVTATGGFDLNYFQDYNPSPIGLFVTVC